ncbi:unnamed protein product [Pipistrellus nathusii]|uniref:Aberrant panicle organization 1 protein n=1 Tax=Pipistrellus nathusii TaxID=59473 RepID=A0ABP0AHR5_PIPNA
MRRADGRGAFKGRSLFMAPVGAGSGHGPFKAGSGHVGQGSRAAGQRPGRWQGRCACQGANGPRWGARGHAADRGQPDTHRGSPGAPAPAPPLGSRGGGGANRSARSKPASALAPGQSAHGSALRWPVVWLPERPLANGEAAGAGLPATFPPPIAWHTEAHAPSGGPIFVLSLDFLAPALSLSLRSVTRDVPAGAESASLLAPALSLFPGSVVGGWLTSATFPPSPSFIWGTLT